VFLSLPLPKCTAFLKLKFIHAKLGISFAGALLNLDFCNLSKNLRIKIYRTINMPVVLHGYETWSLTLREERRLRVFENIGVEENIWT